MPVDEIRYCKKCKAATPRRENGDCKPCRYRYNRERQIANRGITNTGPYYCRRCKTDTFRNKVGHCSQCQQYRGRMKKREIEDFERGKRLEQEQRTKPQPQLQQTKSKPEPLPRQLVGREIALTKLRQAQQEALDRDRDRQRTR